MAEIMRAAECTHVPTMLMSEQDGLLQGAHKAAMDGDLEIARRAKALGADRVVICDTLWGINAGFHVNANARVEGVVRSNEFPQFIQNMPHAYQGNPTLGAAIVQEASDRGAYTLTCHPTSLELEGGTLVALRVLSCAPEMKVVSVAAWCTLHGHDQSRVVGETSDSKALLVASGSVLHRIWPNKDDAANNGTFTISFEFNRQVDLHVLDIWQTGDHGTFLRMVPEYAEYCCGEGAVHDRAMLCGASGLDSHDACCEIITEYFPLSGTSQTNVIFPVQ